MIRPPFTVLILKDSRHPVTIRVTTGLVIVLTGSFILIGLFLGFTATYFALGGKAAVVFGTPKAPEPEFLPAEPKITAQNTHPDIQSLSVRRNDGTGSEMTVHYSSFPDSGEVYIWLFVNPDTEFPGGMVVYPRNPVFRGFPVDYKNGLVLLPDTAGESFTFSLPEEMKDIPLERIRILVYSADGVIIADRYFNENNTEKT